MIETIIPVAIGIFVIVGIVGAIATAIVSINKTEEKEHAEFEAAAVAIRQKFSRPRPRVRVTDSKVLDLFVETGSIRKTAKQLGISNERAQRIILQAGLQGKQSYNNRVSAENRQAIQEALLAGDRSKASIAREFGVSSTTINRISREVL